MAIDWRAHFGRIIEEISYANAAWRCGNPGIPERAWLITSAVWIIGVNRMLRSRHIPAVVRTETSGIPWQAISRLAEHVDKCSAGAISLPARVIEDFNTRVAPALIDPLRELQERLIMMDADGNGRDGLLDLSYRGGHAHVTVRIPADRLDALRMFVAQAYEGRDIPTLEDVRARLAAASETLRDFGIELILVFGSVAAGHASAASDVDLAYHVRQGLTFGRWAELGVALERILGRVVDAHELRPGDDSPIGAVEVWAS